ncbi:hypothetical protein GALMADRAFT_253241, partial [Galerina marginata CBS 339.88]
MLCPLSGISALGGPTRLIDHEDLDTVSTTMASEILSYGQVSLSLQDVASIVSNALELTLPPPEHKYVYDLAPKLPEGVSDWEYFDCIGIGHFNANGFCPIDEDGRSPSGRDVEVRRLDQYDAYGWFYGVLVDDEEGTGMRSEQMCTVCRANTAVPNCNSFVLRGCLEYLRHYWLDPSLPPRVAFMETSPSMNLEGELYEIVNSHDEIRDRSNLFPSIQYGDISKALEQDQFRFLKARNGSRHTSRAIDAGLRNKELLPALFADFQCWLSMRPDIWPSPSTSITPPTFMRFPASPLSQSFGAIPTELLLDIFRQIPIRSLLSLSSASRSLRTLITEPGFLNQTIKAAVLSGSEFWILPVAAIAGEQEQARNRALEWLATVSPDHDVPITESPFHSPSFPYLAFVHACYCSDSMRNRQRLWKIVKQFDFLWRDYRLHGWQRDV